MKNIFENAYFGKVYKTRDGRKAVYTQGSINCHWLAVEGTSFTWGYNNNGNLVSKIDESMNIVSEWQEEIDEEKIDELARKECSKYFIGSNDWLDIINNQFYNLEQAAIHAYIVCFKACYRKALER